MDASARLAAYIESNPDAVGKVMDIAAGDHLYQLDLTAANTELNEDLISDTEKLTAWINAKLKATDSRYAIGGYMEHRTLYARSALFDGEGEPRRLHLGVDIWGDANAPVYAPLDGIIHSFQDNDRVGDYGPTIILQHDLNGTTLYSLYGHLNRESLQDLQVGKAVSKNQQIGGLGDIKVNGHWPPHLHFQLMFDIEGKAGDYPGVGYFSEKARYLNNIPDPNLILRFAEL